MVKKLEQKVKMPVSTRITNIRERPALGIESKEEVVLLNDQRASNERRKSGAHYPPHLLF